MAPLIHRERREAARRALADRRSAVLAAAAKAFATNPYGETSLAGIGRQAGVPEGTAELLFQTREQLFLEVLAQATREWCRDLAAELAGQGTLAPAALAPLLARVLARHPLLTRLMSQVPAAVESVQDPSPLWHAQNRIHEALQPVREELARCCPELGPGRTRVLPLWVLVLICGLEPFAHAAGGMATALVDPTLRDYAVDFETELTAMLTALLC